jgi:CHAD domain-containing protein
VSRPGAHRMPSRSRFDQVVAAMSAQVDAIRALRAGARRARDPEAVHRMRVAVRRLRAILRARRPVVARRSDEEGVDRLRRELKWLGIALGQVRDLDVLRAHLQSLRVDARAGGRAAHGRLLRHIRADRARAVTALRAALDGRRYARLLARLDAMLAAARERTEDVSLPDVAAEEFARLRRAVKRLPKHPSAAELHEIRIKVKHARYAAELAQLDVGRRAERFVAKAKALQDILGAHQDAVVAERYVLRAAGQAPGARTLARQIAARQEERRGEAREAFIEQWPKLKRRGRRAWE